MIRQTIGMTLLWLLPTIVLAQGVPATPKGPEAGTRTHVQNYKDMVLATCIATAYKNDHGASMDAGSSVSALRDWTAYDLEKAPSATSTLVRGYLARDYRNPLAEDEAPGVRFDLLKCLDLYHSKALDDQAKALVIDPGQTSRDDRGK
ncbi:type VI secretion system amidase immunity protein Tai4 [Luteibacter flocculans]|uniref:Type VI secretion system amidase immunity protein Tai4 n=1 Tax=Luteibacter flocculans TaxID=2780091 RepID=A0ABY4SXI7_9GAMM|nr:type VI secretion system amidase immunity protein Tai4 [Luteibacter flocculans]URL57438.1 type VI secretion system amidase immunity protein Tai4 [Luteibacter flocculans]